MSKQNITYGSYNREYELKREKRKSLKLTIKPNLEIILFSPLEANQEKINNFLHRKWQWINKQISFFEKYQKKIYKKEYVSGESFYYLGRQYQLVIKKSKEDNITLSRGKILLEVTTKKENKTYIKTLLDIWYKERSKTIFKERFETLYNKFEYKKKILLRISPMKKKWGSFKGQTITLNPLLLQASKNTIDYVITHELCHVKYKNHNKKFWEFLDEMYPNWEKIKEKLEIKFG